MIALYRSKMTKLTNIKGDIKMDWKKVLDDRVDELIKEGRGYVNEGIARKTVLNMLKSETTIGKKYWIKVSENI